VRPITRQGAKKVIHIDGRPLAKFVPGEQLLAPPGCVCSSGARYGRWGHGGAQFNRADSFSCP
jgi:hypothetical protein